MPSAMAFCARLAKSKAATLRVMDCSISASVVKGMGVPWQTALGAVFLSGVLFLLLTVTGLRQQLVAAIPQELHAAVAGGIGLFIAFIGLRNSGIIVPSPATTVTLGNLHNPATLLACLGIVILSLIHISEPTRPY